jgi:hypothetical protein
LVEAIAAKSWEKWLKQYQLGLTKLAEAIAITKSSLAQTAETRTTSF